MDNGMLNDPTKIPNEVLYIVLAAAGGIADYLSRFMKGEKFMFTHFLSRGFIGGFAGLMVGFVGNNWGLDGQLLFAAAGVAGCLLAGATMIIGALLEHVREPE